MTLLEHRAWIWALLREVAASMAKRLWFAGMTNCVLPQQKGPHIFQTCPSANYYNCKAMAIGSRSQSARTYLEKHLETFQNCTTWTRAMISATIIMCPPPTKNAWEAASFETLKNERNGLNLFSSCRCSSFRKIGSEGSGVASP